MPFDWWPARRLTGGDAKQVLDVGQHGRDDALFSAWGLVQGRVGWGLGRGGVGISFATAREGVRAACVGGVRSAPPGSASRRSHQIRLTSLNRQLGTRINHLHLSSLRYASPRSAQPKAESFFSFIPSYLLLYCSKLNTLIPRTFCLPGGRRMTGTRAGNGRRPRKNHQRTGSQHIDEIEDFRSPNRRAIGRELGDNWSVGGRAKISQQ